MKICYREIKFRSENLGLLGKINNIIREYQSKGYSLTLRQVYYQLVARDVIPNTERSYKNMGNLISDGRIAGIIDWDAIEDRTRDLEKNSHWETPSQIIDAVANQFALDKWEGQEYYVEVWVEKDALKGIVGQVCERLDIPYFSCRGYVSQSEMWVAAQRLQRMARDKELVIIHLGDHDPSGRDMSRDIVDRLNFFGTDLTFRRIALNMDQIDQYSPPPNPTKVEDPRAIGYIEEFGHTCWELDALKPEVIDQLISDTVGEYMDMELIEQVQGREDEAKRVLQNVSRNWEEIESNYN
jgi:hypothetical protein